MRYLSFFLMALLFASCASMPEQVREPAEAAEPASRDATARIIFVNYHNEEVYVRLRRGNTERNIGTMNQDERGGAQRISSAIPPGKSGEYRIAPGRYTIVLKKDESGRIDAEGNLYEEFNLPPSAAGYEIHLFSSHERSTTVTIDPGEGTISLNPSFTLYFSADMIPPIVEDNVSLVDEGGRGVGLAFEWQNKRRLILRPREPLQPAAGYILRVQLEARSAEGDRIREAAEAYFTTDDNAEIVSPLDPSSFRYDTSVPGDIRFDWDLPPGANGSELWVLEGISSQIIDLQAKTNYTFSDDEIETLRYKVVPYRIMGGRKAYNQAARNGPFIGLPWPVVYGIRHALTVNTPGQLVIRFTFNGIRRIPEDFEFFLNGGTVKDFRLSGDNGFTCRIDNPPGAPGEIILYKLTLGNGSGDYAFPVERPPDGEFFAAFERRVLGDMTVILGKLRGIDRASFAMGGELEKDNIRFVERQNFINNIYKGYTGYAYPPAINRDEYIKRVQTNPVFAEIQTAYTDLYNQLVHHLIVSLASGYNTADARIGVTKSYLDGTSWLTVKDQPEVKRAVQTVEKKFANLRFRNGVKGFFGNDARFWSLGLSTGTSFAAPWLIGTAHATIAPFPYSYLDVGCDIGILSSVKSAESYWSYYPFVHYNFFIPFGYPSYSGGWYAGAGAGWMRAEYGFPEGDVSFSIAALDITTGFNLFNWLDISYVLRTDFHSVNHKISLGCTFRFK